MTTMDDDTPDPTPYLNAPAPDGYEASVDATGLLCPLPIVHLSKALRRCAPGDTVYVVATDAGFFPDLLRWIRVRKAEILALDETSEHYLAWVRKTD